MSEPIPEWVHALRIAQQVPLAAVHLLALPAEELELRHALLQTSLGAQVLIHGHAQRRHEMDVSRYARLSPMEIANSARAVWARFNESQPPPEGLERWAILDDSLVRARDPQPSGGREPLLRAAFTLLIVAITHAESTVAEPAHHRGIRLLGDAGRLEEARAIAESVLDAVGQGENPRRDREVLEQLAPVLSEDQRRLRRALATYGAGEYACAASELEGTEGGLVADLIRGRTALELGDHEALDALCARMVGSESPLEQVYGALFAAEGALFERPGSAPPQSPEHWLERAAEGLDSPQFVRTAWTNFYEVAARMAEEQGDPDQALEHLQTAQKLAADLGVTRRHAGLRADRARLLGRLGRLSEAYAELEELVAEFANAGRSMSYCGALLDIAWLQELAGHSAHGRESAVNALSIATQDGIDGLAVGAHLRLAQEARNLGEVEVFARHVAEARPLVERLGQPRMVATLAFLEAAAHDAAGRREASLAGFRRVVEAMEAFTRPSDGLSIVGQARAALEPDPMEGAEIAIDCARIAFSMGLQTVESEHLLQAAVLARRGGLLHQSHVVIQRAYSVAMDTRSARLIVEVLEEFALVEWRLGRVDDAEESRAVIRQMREEIGADERDLHLQAMALEARLDGDLDALVEAAGALRAIGQVTAAWEAHLDAARIAYRTGEPERARDRLAFLRSQGIECPHLSRDIEALAERLAHPPDPLETASAAAQLEVSAPSEEAWEDDGDGLSWASVEPAELGSVAALELGDLALTLPEAWSVGGGQVTLLAGSHEHVRPNVIVSSEPVPDGVDLSDYYQRMRDLLRESRLETAIVDEAWTTVGGEPARVLLCTSELPIPGENGHVFQMQVVVVRRGRAWTLTASFPLGSHGPYLSELRSVIQAARWQG